MNFIENDRLGETLDFKQKTFINPIEEKKNNFFKIIAMNEDGTKKVIEGFNAVLNSGRDFNAFKLTHIDILNTMVYDENGTVVTPKSFVNTDVDCELTGLFGFSCLGATVSGPTEPIPTAILPTAKFTDQENLNVNPNSKVMMFPLPGVDVNGEDFGSNIAGRKIKAFTRIDSEIDDNGVAYTKISLDIDREEFVDKYWNEIIIWAEIVENGKKYYLPYSCFAFNPMSNGGGAFSYEIFYGIYL